MHRSKQKRLLYNRDKTVKPKLYWCFEKYGRIEIFGTKERGTRRNQSTLQSTSQYCKPRQRAAIAPAVERTLGKGEVACSNHAGSTIIFKVSGILRSYLCRPPICILRNASTFYPLFKQCAKAF